ncbi:MAG: hypothetical protein HY548_02710, partial [Elusimicrobia bacterium]|nr:hypothetical protein [Elusimicrobiota bacterium]
ISATTDTMFITPEILAPGGATQGQDNVPVLKLMLNTDSRTVIWKGVRLDRSNVNQVNRPKDVKEARIYYDSDGNDIFNPAVDQVVSPLPVANEPHIFPETTLTAPANPGDTVLTVGSVDGFPAPPGRLILEDNTGNVEIVTFTAVNPVAKQFTVERSLPALTHPAGSTASGPMQITVLGSLGGQEILANNVYRPQTKLTSNVDLSNSDIIVEDTSLVPPSGTLELNADQDVEQNVTYTGKTPTSFTGISRLSAKTHTAGVVVSGARRNKTYYVTFDIDDLATVGSLVGRQVELGLSMRNNTYLAVGAPDLISNSNLPLTASILDINEYADEVTATPFNPDNSTPQHGDDTLQQKATNQLVLGFALSASQSEAFWTGMLVRSTGTAIPTEDVSTVTVWMDGNRNGFLDPETGFDIVLGTGAFGNSGETSVAQVLFPQINVRTLVTAARAFAENVPNRFFVTYDIKPTATPNKTLGARIAGDGDFFVSSPNDVIPANLPFAGKLRTIIPAPQEVRAEFLPLFTSLQGSATMQSLTAPTLGGDIAVSDTLIPVMNTDGLPLAGYAVIDSEIIFYASKGPGALQGVQRGQLNTAAAAHATGALVGTQYTQSEKNLAFLRMRVSVVDPQGYDVRWFKLKLNRLQPAGLAGKDGDIAAVRLYRDTGSPGLDRNPVSGTVNDILLAEKKFGDGETAAQATLSLNNSLLGGASYYAVITVQPQDYFLVMEIDPTATFDDVVGLRVPGPTNLIVGAQTPGDGVHSVRTDNFPGVSAAAVIRATVDTMQVRSDNLMPPNIAQNQKTVPVLRFNLRANTNTVVWQKLRLNMLTNNGAVDGDIQTVGIYKDVDNNGIFDPAVDGVQAARLSQGTEKFTMGVANVTLNAPEVITSTPSGHFYYVAFDVSNLAQVGKTVAVSLGDPGHFTVGAPDLVSYLSGQVADSDMGTITEVADNVTLGIEDLAEAVNASGGVSQGTPNVPFLKFTLITNISQAAFEKIRVERTGTSNNQLLPEGSNRDVAAIKIWDDSNFNGTFDPGDSLVSIGTNTFNTSIEADKQKEIFIATNPAVIVANGSARVLFLTYDISNTVDATNTVGVKIVDQNSLTMSAPNGMVNYYQDLKSGATMPYSFQGSRVTVKPILIQATSENIAPAAVSQLTVNVPLLKFKMHTDINTALLNALTLRQIGTVEGRGAPGQGQGDFARAAIWLDNGDDVFVAAQDRLLGEALHGTPAFTGGFARIPFQGGYSLGVTSATFFVTVDVGERDAANQPTINHQAGFSLEGLSGLDKLPSTARDYASNVYPMKSGLISILKAGLPKIAFIASLPKIWIDSDKDLYPDVDFNGNGKIDDNEKSVRYPKDSDGEPIIDVDGDGVQDNRDMNGDGRKNELDMDGDNLPDMDMDGDGLIDFDFNSDGMADTVLGDLNGDNIPELDLSRDGTVNWGKLPERWTNETTKLSGRWPRLTDEVSDYQVGVGNRPDPDDLNNLTSAFAAAGWLSAGNNNQYTVTNLLMTAAQVTRTVTNSVGRLAEPPFDLYVQGTDGYSGEGYIYIGSEIMRYNTKSGGAFHITARAQFSTQVQDHPQGQKVTNNGFFFNVRALGKEGAEGPGAPVAVHRVDVTAPSVPTAPKSDPELSKKPAELGRFEIKWTPSADDESGVREYEIQERVDNDPVWRTVTYVPSSRTSYIIGEGKVAGDEARPKGHFYTYRVRARNHAGGWSAWSPVSGAAFTGLPDETISEVYNYPNPADTRISPTYITYLLNEDANVTVTLYDLLGYKVKQWEFPAGTQGGRTGPNSYPWDGTNDDGTKVSAGGYILRIEVRGSKGTTTVIRKIGIIH